MSYVQDKGKKKRPLLSDLGSTSTSSIEPKYTRPLKHQKSYDTKQPRSQMHTESSRRLLAMKHENTFKQSFNGKENVYKDTVKSRTNLSKRPSQDISRSYKRPKIDTLQKDREVLHHFKEFESKRSNNLHNKESVAQDDQRKRAIPFNNQSTEDIQKEDLKLEIIERIEVEKVLNGMVQVIEEEEEENQRLEIDIFNMKNYQRLTARALQERQEIHDFLHIFGNIQRTDEQQELEKLKKKIISVKDQRQELKSQVLHLKSVIVPVNNELKRTQEEILEMKAQMDQLRQENEVLKRQQIQLSKNKGRDSKPDVGKENLVPKIAKNGGIQEQMDLDLPNFENVEVDELKAFICCYYTAAETKCRNLMLRVKELEESKTSL